MRVHVALFLTLVLLLPGSAFAQTGPEAVLAEAAERYRAVESLCADFEQRLTIPLLDAERTSRGELCQRRPNLFSMTFSDPEGDRVVADGEHFWLYYRSQNPGQVIRTPVDPGRGGLDFHREFLQNPLEKYEVSGGEREVIEGRETVRVNLRPLDGRGYRGAVVWIDPDSDLVRQIEITEANGTIRLLTLSDIRLDPALPEDAFRFDVPEGVQVITTGTTR